MQQTTPLYLAGVQGLSETGPIRRHNEDRFLVDTALGLAAVADGMGGHRAGAQASTDTLAALQAALAAPGNDDVAPQDPDATAVDARWRHIIRLQQAITQANAALYRRNRAHGRADGQGMGTTLTGWQWLPALAAIVQFHVGDSRLYRYRDGVLCQLTRDHTAYQLALESAAVGALPPQNLLLQAVGPAPSVTPDIALHAVYAGDLLLLCSDGLHGWVPHAELQQALDDAGSDLDAACAHLVALAKLHSSRDNITAVLARFAATDRLHPNAMTARMS